MQILLNNNNSGGGSSFSGISGNIQCTGNTNAFSPDVDKSILSGITAQVSDYYYNGFVFMKLVEAPKTTSGTSYTFRIKDNRKNIIWEGYSSQVLGLIRSQEYLQLHIVNKGVESQCFLRIDLPKSSKNYKKSDFSLILNQNQIFYRRTNNSFPENINISFDREVLTLQANKWTPLNFSNNSQVISKAGINKFLRMPNFTIYLIELGDYIQL